MGVTMFEEEAVGEHQRFRVFGTKAVAKRLMRRDDPTKQITDGRVRQYADAGDRWVTLVAPRMGITEDEVRRRLLARAPTIVEVGDGGRVVGLTGVAAEIHSDRALRRKGGELEYAVDFPLVGRRVVDLLRDLGVEPEGINAEREWTFTEVALDLFMEVLRREPGNPAWIAMRGQGVKGAEEAGPAD